MSRPPGQALEDVAADARRRRVLVEVRGGTPPQRLLLVGAAEQPLDLCRDTVVSCSGAASVSSGREIPQSATLMRASSCTGQRGGGSVSRRCTRPWPAVERPPREAEVLSGSSGRGGSGESPPELSWGERLAGDEPRRAQALGVRFVLLGGGRRIARRSFVQSSAASRSKTRSECSRPPQTFEMYATSTVFGSFRRPRRCAMCRRSSSPLPLTIAATFGSYECPGHRFALK